MSHVILSDLVDPFLAASVWELMRECACHTGNSQQSSLPAYRVCHTVVDWSLDVGAGRQHFFWLQVFFLQTNDLLLALSQADHVREASWLLKRYPGVVAY